MYFSLPAIAQCHDIQTELNGIFSHDLWAKGGERGRERSDLSPASFMMHTHNQKRHPGWLEWKYALKVQRSALNYASLYIIPPVQSAHKYKYIDTYRQDWAMQCRSTAVLDIQLLIYNYRLDLQVRNANGIILQHVLHAAHSNETSKERFTVLKVYTNIKACN